MKNISFFMPILRILIVLGFFIFSLFWLLRNPSLSGLQKVETAPLSNATSKLNDHVDFLSKIIPTRSIYFPESLQKARDYIFSEFKDMGYSPELQEYEVDGLKVQNIIVTYGDPSHKTLRVIGAHYDTAGQNNPGADDNASGVAALLELARHFMTFKPKLAIPHQFVAFTLEEPPYFGGDSMGSAFHSRDLKSKNTKVDLMLSLETLGYYSEKPGSQHFPLSLLKLFYPSRGNFIGLVSNLNSRKETRKLRTLMNSSLKSLKAFSINSPEFVHGIGDSDHYQYWHDSPAIMVTDTAYMRNLEYHQSGDTADRLNFNYMNEVVQALYHALINF